MDAKTKSVIAHIIVIGWIVALIMNSSSGQERHLMTSYYLRQLVGIQLLMLVGSIIPPFIGWAVLIFSVILWVISLLGALSGETKEVPFLGEYFQEWFKGL
jgi:uncharacterized membrane protein